MKKRMTLTFKSKKGNEYLYDDSTGLILPWSKEDEKILKQLLERKCLLYAYNKWIVTE